MANAPERQWPRGATPGGWTIGPATEADGKPVKREGYLSATQVQERVGMSRAFYDLRRRDGGIWVCDPAVLVGDVPGWEEKDVTEWGIESGLLLEDGTVPEKRARAGRKKLAEPYVTWRRQTRVYLTSLEVAVGTGIGAMAISLRRDRGTFIEPTVTIGERDGFALETASRWALQVGHTWTTPEEIAAAITENEGRLI